ncbi:MAG TPA: DUF3472 domain-containing protein [Fibrobacteria bacterium]|nr:DUF3472 domain-containing protein [Fibrobacteria bacterium]
MGIGLACLGCISLGYPQNSAPSSHFNFSGGKTGSSNDIFVSQVRVPNASTLNTFYETIWWSGKTTGYAGIQDSAGVHVFIFSVWDNGSGRTDSIRTVFSGYGMRTSNFGGEGTGRHSIGHIPWKTDLWYTLVSRCWPAGKRTYFGLWYKDAVTGNWRHLVTLSAPSENAVFENGYNDAFLEDFSNDGGRNARQIHLRGFWVRGTAGNWTPLTQGNYSVNDWDLDPAVARANGLAGARSSNYRNSWTGGVKQDGTGTFAYMISGGPAIATAKNHADFDLPMPSEKSPGYAPAGFTRVDYALPESGRLAFAWDVDSASAPQFGYSLQLFATPDFSGKPLATLARNEPERRADTLALTGVNLGGTVYGRFTVQDIFGYTSNHSTFTLQDNGARLTPIRRHSPDLPDALRVERIGPEVVRVYAPGRGSFGIEISDMRGRVVYREPGIRSPSKELDFRALGLPAGLTALRVETERGEVFQRLLPPWAPSLR